MLTAKSRWSCQKWLKFVKNVFFVFFGSNRLYLYQKWFYTGTSKKIESPLCSLGHFETFLKGFLQKPKTALWKGAILETKLSEFIALRVFFLSWPYSGWNIHRYKSLQKNIFFEVAPTSSPHNPNFVKNPYFSKKMTKIWGSESAGIPAESARSAGR